jgi:hypothetical protein
MPIDKDHKLMNEQGAVNELISRGYIVMKKAELLGRLQA